MNSMRTSKWNTHPKAVVGLGYGDEGKGMTVATLVHEINDRGGQPVVVRYNGGPQAAHNVRVNRAGKMIHHTFSQFGSGSLEGAATILADTTLVHPYLLANEALEIMKLTNWNPIQKLTLDPMAPLLLPVHAQLNRELERRRGSKRHGSTGMGVGAARDYELTMNERGQGDLVPRVRDMTNPFALKDKMLKQADWLSRRWSIDFGYNEDKAEDEATKIHLVYADLSAGGCAFEDTGKALTNDYAWTPQDVVFEGSQGIMIDLRYGYFPHVTYGWLDAANAVSECKRGHLPPPIVVGATRTYATRHGTGPFPQEGTKTVLYKGEDNSTGVWQGAFREGLLDLPTLEYGANIVKPDVLAVSCEDLYEQTGGRVIDKWIGEDGRILNPGDYALSADDSIRREDNDKDFDPATVYAPLLAAKGHEVSMDLGQLEQTISAACHAPIIIRGHGNVISDWEVNDTVPFESHDEWHERQTNNNVNKVAVHERA